MPHLRWHLMLIFLCYLGHASKSHGQVPRFALAPFTKPLNSEIRPRAFFDVVGEKAAVLGRENGDFEAWIFPFQILTDFGLEYRLDEMPAPDEVKHYARRIEVFPERTMLVYSHPLFTLKEHIFVPIHEPAVVILLEIDTYRKLELFVRFMASLQPMWPAGMGGQYAFWDDQLNAYILSESRRRFNAVIGTARGERRSPPLAHELPRQPNLFAFSVSPEGGRKFFYPILITANFRSRDACIQKYKSLMQDPQGIFSRTRAEYQRFLQNSLTLAGTEFDQALLWNKLALHRGFICNPDLGCGMVAGFGPSGASRRPGFAWFFGGDAFINSFAMLGYGDTDRVKRAIAFLQKYQRKDGKMMHELSQSAGLIDWFGEYPYGYIHGDTTPLYLAAMANYFSTTADTEFIRQSWPSIHKAYTWCRSTDSRGDGLMENTLAGLGASELGSLREASGVDIFLAGIGVQAWKCYAKLARLFGQKGEAKQAEKWFETGKSNLEQKFWNGDSQRYNFSLTRSGKPNPELTAWSAFPMIFDLLPAEHAQQALVDVASARISTDWGCRMLSRTSAAYDPVAYNNGAVWPFLTGYVTWALFRQHQAAAGLQNLRNLSNWIVQDALGAMPEVCSGEYFRPLETSVPHQLFSSFGFVAGLIKGLLGLEVDAPHRKLRLAPHLPLDWPSFRISNLVVGKDTLSLRLQQSFDRFHLQVLRRPREAMLLEVQPAFGPFATLDSAQCTRGLDIKMSRSAADTHFGFQINPREISAVELVVRDPLRLWLPDERPRAGDATKQLKLCSVKRLSRKKLQLLFEAPGGSQKILHYRALHPERVAVQNAEILDEQNIRILFEGNGFIRKKVVFTFSND